MQMQLLSKPKYCHFPSKFPVKTGKCPRANSKKGFREFWLKLGEN